VSQFTFKILQDAITIKLASLLGESVSIGTEEVTEKTPLPYCSVLCVNNIYARRQLSGVYKLTYVFDIRYYPGDVNLQSNMELLHEIELQFQLGLQMVTNGDSFLARRVQTVIVDRVLHAVIPFDVFVKLEEDPGDLMRSLEYSPQIKS
jgi:hypothetical protein